MEACGTWVGSGFCNHRASLQTLKQNRSPSLVSYGDHFMAGDVVGVLLDMNRGRISFFLDGMKFGEHIVADLGQAFSGLSAHDHSKPRTLFPVVGVMRGSDRVTIIPRWMSSFGRTSDAELDVLSRSWHLLNSWNTERPTSSPLPGDLWVYRAAWRDWMKWRVGSSGTRIKTRCRAFGLEVAVDCSPLACVIASLKLGLSRALFREDHIVFSRSSGRLLTTPEEAVILGEWLSLDCIPPFDLCFLSHLSLCGRNHSLNSLT